MAEGSGTTLYDISGNGLTGNVGTRTAGTFSWVNDQRTGYPSATISYTTSQNCAGQGFDIGSTLNSATLPISSPLYHLPITVAFWLYPTENITSGNYNPWTYVFTQDFGGSNKTGFFFTASTTFAENWGFIAGESEGTLATNKIIGTPDGPSLTFDKWHLLVGVINATGIYEYQDGIYIGNSIFNSGYSYQPPTSSDNIVFTRGGCGQAGSYQDAGAWSASWTPSEVSAFYNSVTPNLEQ
jgi:hypothetical protein